MDLIYQKFRNSGNILHVCMHINIYVYKVMQDLYHQQYPSTVWKEQAKALFRGVAQRLQVVRMVRSLGQKLGDHQLVLLSRQLGLH